MNTIEVTLSAPHLVMSLSCELGVAPTLLAETIKETPELLKLANSYGRGEITYNQMLEALLPVF